MEENIWKDEEIRLAKKMKKRASALSFIYNESAKRFLTINNNILLSVGIINVVITIGVIIPNIIGLLPDNSNSTMINKKAENGVSISVGIISAACAVLIFVSKQMDFSGKWTKHANASTRFNNIYLEISTALGRGDGQRANFYDFFQEICRRDQQEQMAAGPIPDQPIDVYYAKHGERATPKEELFGEIYTLEILDDIPDLKASAKRTHDQAYQMARIMGVVG